MINDIPAGVACVNITAKLLHTITDGLGEQRFYKLSAPIEKFTNGLTTVKKELEYTRRFLREDFKNLIPQGISGWDIICVSDAHTHLERLVFLGCKVGEGKYYRLSPIQLDGVHTMMIHGGSRDKMYPDKVYLRRLASANGYKFGGITDD